MLMLFRILLINMGLAGLLSIKLLIVLNRRNYCSVVSMLQSSTSADAYVPKRRKAFLGSGGTRSLNCSNRTL